VPLSLLKGLAPFAPLTTAEAAVFEAHIEQRTFSAGDAISADDALLIVKEGFIAISVGDAANRSFAVVGAGDLLGELTLFEPAPIPIEAKAQTNAVCLSLNMRELKRCFQYSRTGAARFMMVCARSLSKKLRSADEALNQSHTSSSATPQASPLAALDRERLKGLAVARQVADGALIFGEATPGAELFVITKGEVEIVRGKGGDAVSVARLGPGDFFGEMAFVDRAPRSASAVARTPVELNVIPADALERVVEFNVGTALHLSNIVCKILARRLNATLRRTARSQAQQKS
jgi:CRP-like cAMP-binding protein